MIIQNQSQEPTRAAIWYALDNYQYQDAVFLSERLHAEINTVETRYLLATCYYRAGYKREAIHLLRSSGELRDIQSKLLYARCCLDLKEYKTGLVILNGLLCTSDNNEQEIISQYGQDAGVAFWLLGELNRQSHMFDEAVKHFRSSLKCNPYLWSSFEALCHLGEDLSPEEYFVAEKCPKFQQHHVTMTTEAHVPEAVAEKTITEANPDSVVGEHTAIDTPELYANPALGCAQASSTPDPRGQVAQKDEKLGGISDPSPLSQTLWGSVNSLSTAPGNLLPPSLSSVRTVLHFGSGRSGVASTTSTGSKKSLKTSMQSSGALTPVNPSFGMFTVAGAAHAITPTSNIKPAELSDVDQSAYSSASSTTFSAPRKKHSIPSIARVAYSGGPQGRVVPRVGGIATENITLSSDAMLYLTPRDDADPAMSNDGELVSPAVDDGCKSVENMQPGHTSGKTEATPRRSARLSVAKQQSRLQDLSTPVVKGKSRAQSFRTTATDRMKKVTKGGSSSQSMRKIVSPRRSSHPLTLGNKQNIQRGRAVLATPTQREEQNMEMGSDIKKVKLLTEGPSIYSSSISSLMKLMVDIAMAYKALSCYELSQCLELFSSLPPHQLNTPWVFTQVARAHFEQGNYNEAVRLYQQVQSIDPYRFQGMEYYSASLWHLEKATELSVLADDLRHADTLRPETWCVMGNLMSLTKDHEAAIKFIERAIQVCPHFVYAYQLLSHEYIITENYDKALQVLRTAVSIDPRSCDSWFVMGVIYYLQEKYRFAEHHIKKAIAINKSSSLMYSQLGMVHCATEAYNEALQCLDKAVKLDPSKVLPRFDRTRVLQKAGCLQEALTELEELANRVPKEAQIYLQMGKIYQQLGQSHEAVMKFSWAQSLDGGRSGSQIKQEIDRTFQQWPRQGMAEEFDCYAEADSFNTTANSDIIDHEEDPMEN